MLVSYAVPPHIHERLPLARAHAEAVLGRAVPSPHADNLLRTAYRAGTAAQRVLWLRKAASAWSEPLVQHAACRRGCSHCCHIPVTITDVEARIIGKAIGRPPERPAGALSIEEAAEALAALPGTAAVSYASPCTFLEDGLCSIYAHRPPACRVHINLDRDELLCRLEPGASIPVPYANSTEIKAHYALLQPSAVWADIRAFFPPDGAASARSPRMKRDWRMDGAGL